MKEIGKIYKVTEKQKNISKDTKESLKMLCSFVTNI